MIKSEIEYANVSINWTFNHIIPQLPAPGTDAFAFLIKELRPYDLSPQQITVDAPNTTLGDVVLGFILLDRKVSLRMTYGGLEINAQDITGKDAENILKIINITFTALSKIDAEVVNGNVGTRVGLHITLQEKTVDDYFAERISVTLANKKITPEAMVFLLQTDELTKSIQTRLTVAKSLAYENALFVDINYQADSTSESFYSQNPSAFFEHLSNNYQNVISILELETIDEENE
jgi:hypothetical protein